MKLTIIQKKHILTVFISILLVNTAFAQVQQKQALFFGRNNLQQQDYSIGYEYRANPRSGFALLFSYMQHNRQPAVLFNGDAVAKYIIRREEEKSISTGVLRVSKDWYQVSGNEPFEKLKPFLPLESYLAKVAFRTSFQRKKSPFRLTLMPSVQYVRHSYFAINDQRNEVDGFKETYIAGVYPYEKKITASTMIIEEIRQMRQRNVNLYGFGYDIGLAYHFKHQFFIETRGGIGLNYGQTYKEELPAAFRAFSYGFGLFLGYSF
jgi:hypothetical protein